MKKIAVLTLTLILLFAMTVPASAAGSGPGGNAYRYGRGTFAVVGRITAINASARTVTLTVLRANKLAQPSIGTSITLQTTSATRFYRCSASGTCTPITFANLAVGDYISANGQLANNIWTAVRITVGARLQGLPQP